MGPLELFLALLGLALAILLSPPGLRGIISTVEKVRRRQWSGEHYRKGDLQNKNHIAFDEWSCIFEIDDSGNCTQTYNVRLRNISRKLVNVFYVPVFCDTKPLQFQDIQPWARNQRKDLVVEADAWNELGAEGRIKINFSKPVGPGERRKFSYGLKLPTLFRPGDDYYDWDVEIPHYDMKGEIRFSDSWRILYARWNVTDQQFLAEPTIENQSIIWKAAFPKPGTRLHMELGISKKSP